MTPLIPDTMQGALTLSLIDFLLSFVVISFIGVLLTAFPLLNRVADWLAAWQLKSAAKKVGAIQAQPMARQATPDEDVAVIMAAISSLMGGEHHILNIEPSKQGAGWLAEGRQAQHQSHQPLRPPGR